MTDDKEQGTFASTVLVKQVIACFLAVSLIDSGLFLKAGMCLVPRGMSNV